jgi:hypothetical protein
MLLPLFRNAIDRLYRKQFDSFVKGSVSFFGKIILFVRRILLTFVLMVFQVLFIVLMFPTMLWVPVAEKFFPRLFSVKIGSDKPFENMRYVARIVIKANFWEILFKQ